MNIQNWLEKYKGKRVPIEKLSKYEKWALDFFHQREHIQNPYLSLIMQLDITEAGENYQNNFKQAQGASLTSFLFWSLIQTLKKHPAFNYRKLNDTWYSFENIPLYIPTAVGGRERFCDITLENVFQMNWQEYSQAYRDAVTPVLKEKPPFRDIPQDYWMLSLYIVNLPNIQFTGFGALQNTMWNGKPYFAFGKRYEENGKLKIPFGVHFDHANLDPYLVDLFLKDFEKNLCSQL